MNVFRAALLFNPHFVKTTRPTVVDVDRIPDLPFLIDGLQLVIYTYIQAVKDELSTYIVKSDQRRDGFKPELGTLQW